MKKIFFMSLVFCTSIANAVTFDAYKDLLEDQIICKSESDPQFHLKFMQQSGFIGEKPMHKGGVEYAFLNKYTVFDLPVTGVTLDGDKEGESSSVGVIFNAPIKMVKEKLQHVGLKFPDPRIAKAEADLKAGRGASLTFYQILSVNGKPNMTKLLCTN